MINIYILLLEDMSRGKFVLYKTFVPEHLQTLFLSSSLLGSRMFFVVVCKQVDNMLFSGD